MSNLLLLIVEGVFTAIIAFAVVYTLIHSRRLKRVEREFARTVNDVESNMKDMNNTVKDLLAVLVELNEGKK